MADWSNFKKVNAEGGSDWSRFKKVSAEQPKAPEPSWWERNITGVRDEQFGDLRTVFDEEDFRTPRIMGAMTAGASDAQLSDIVKRELGDRFQGVEKDANGYDVVSWTGQDGTPKRAYLNAPGLDRRDIARGLLGSIPYTITGAGGLLVGAGRGLLANMGLQGVIGGATSVAGDLAQVPLGSEQGIEGDKAANTTAFSAAGPLVGRAASGAYQYVRNRAGAIPQEVAPLARGAVNRVTEVMDADRLGPQAYQTARDELGMEGMLADMGHNLRATNAVIARTPGEGKSIVMDAQNFRTEYAPNRIRSEFDNALGPQGNQRAYVEAQRVARNQEVAPLYTEFHQAQIPESGQIGGLIQRIQRSMPGAFSEARSLAVADGIDPQYLTNLADDPMGAITGTQTASQGARVWTGAELDYLKRAVDGVAQNAGGDRNKARIFGGLARSLRNSVDEILSPDNPANSPWAQARAIAGEGLEGEEALAQGRRVFTEKRDPFEVQEELNDLSAFGRDVYTRAARDDVRRTMGRASSAYGTTGDNAARRQFQNDFNRENLRTIAGDDAANAVTRRVNAETEFARTRDLAMNNSVTSTMEAAKKMVPGAVTNESGFAAEAGKKGPVGMATEAVVRVLNAMTNNVISGRNELLRRDMARILSATGPERDRIVRGLMELRQGRALRADQAAMIDRIINGLSIASRGPVATSSPE